jgi:hypothetical protein
MGLHINKQIRDAATALLTGLAGTGANVFSSRVYPLQDAELPALRIYTAESDITPMTMGGAARIESRSIMLRVEICGKTTANYDDAADASAVLIEKAVANSGALSGLCKFVHLSRIEVEHDASADQVVTITRLIFECIAHTAANAPDVAL